MRQLSFWLALVFGLSGSVAVADPAPEATTGVVFLQKLNHQIVTVSKDYISSCCPSCARYGSMYYESVQDADRAQVQTCLANHPANYELTRSDSVTHVCKKHWYGDDVAGGHVGYRLHKAGSTIRIEYNMRLNFPQDGSIALGDATLEFMRSKTAECLDKVKDFWLRYGIEVNIHMDTAQNPTLSPVDREVDMHLGGGRSNSGEFYFAGQGAKDRARTMCQLSGCNTFSEMDENRSTCSSTYNPPSGPRNCTQFAEDVRQDEYCLLLLHETGHHLGLPDEYADSDCPDREGISGAVDPHAVMDDQYYGWRHIDFFPRHIAAVLAPLCGPYGP
ncbi:MAG TPA: hypothetical protein VL588_09745 [Bdellovibrionota bacterium]|nr:hypothetical protein [Bdellovibrionota bacterium]